MKSKNIVLITLVFLVLAPMVAVSGMTIPQQQTVAADDWNSSVGVSAGLTIKYSIDELVVPDMEGIAIPDLSGNTLYVKVLDVENYNFGEVTGVLIRYAIGIQFINDETFSIGEGLTALDITIPAGAASPPIAIEGVPHFNSTFAPTTPFFLNNDWAEHSAALTFSGFTVTDVVDSLTASITIGEGSASASWRKSDGILTALSIDNLVFMDLNMTGASLSISLASVETKGITVSVGDEIVLKADIATLDITGAGDLYSMLDQDIISGIEQNVTSIQDNTILKFVVDDVQGLYYKCSVFSYDLNTQSLVAMDYPVVFNAFFGTIQTTEPPMLYDTFISSPLGIEGGATSQYMPIFAPIVTADWDIYGGYMVLLDTIVGVYLDDLLSAFIAIDTSSTELPFTINTIDGNFELSENRGYHYLQESLNLDVTASITDLSVSLSLQVDLSLEANVIVTQEAWVAYSSDGVIAGMRMKLDVTAEITSEYGTEISGLPTGSLAINLDIKLINPEYNPPDPLGGGIIPGFTWLVALPALVGIAAIGLIARKRK